MRDNERARTSGRERAWQNEAIIMKRLEQQPPKAAAAAAAVKNAPQLTQHNSLRDRGAS